MAEKPTKKYLLYIHDERFRAEEEKSGLVNALLKEFYSAEGADEINNIRISVPGVKVGTSGIKTKPKTTPMCKHGQRGDCPVKGCVWLVAVGYN